MDINLRAFSIGFIITVILNIILYFQTSPALVPPVLAPIIGGLVTGYMITGKYTDGAVYGGFSVGMAIFIYEIVFGLIFQNYIFYTIIGAIGLFLLDFIVGAICGIIGVFIKVKITN